MQIKLESHDDNQATYHIAIPLKTVDEITEDILAEASPKAQIPGFRPGHAPKAMLKRRLGRHLVLGIKEELEKKVIEEFKTQSINPIRKPVISYEKDALNEDWEMRASIIPSPSIKELPDILKNGIQLDEYEPDESDIQHEMTQRQRREATMQAVEDEPPKQGDVITISCGYLEKDNQGDNQRLENVKLDTEIAGEKTLTTLNPFPWMPKLEKALGTLVPGDNVKIPVKAIPEAWNDPKLVGKAAVFHLEILKIERPLIDALGDESARDLGFEDLKDWREKESQYLIRQAERINTINREQKIIDNIIQHTTFSIAERAVDMMIMRDLINQKVAAAQQGVNLSDDDMGIKNTDEHRAHVVNAIKQSLVLEKLMSLHGGEPSYDEIKTATTELITSQFTFPEPEKEEQLAKEPHERVENILASDRNVEEVQTHIQRKRAFAHLHENVPVEVLKKKPLSSLSSSPPDNSLPPEEEVVS